MEGDIAVDASCVPPRSEGPNEVHSAETQDFRNQQQTQVVVDNNQGQNHAYEIETSATSSSVLSDVHTPHKDWKYNKLLVDLSDALTDDDLKIMKRMYEGEIGHGALEKITDALSLFSSMEKRFDLSSINLLTLCALLYIAHRCDLIRKVAEYSKKTENALYLDPPKRLPVNGYKYVEFHVAGRDFTKTTKKDLRDFIKNVATLLTVEERFIKLVGVNPSSSIKITILLRERDVTALQNVLEKKDSVDSKARLFLLVFYGVDTVVIGDETFRIQDALSDPIEDDEQMQLDMHQLLHKYRHALEETELENQTLKNKVRKLQAKIGLKRDEQQCVTNMVAAAPQSKDCSVHVEEDYGGNRNNTKADIMQRILSTKLAKVTAGSHDKKPLLLENSQGEEPTGPVKIMTDAHNQQQLLCNCSQ